MKDPKKINSKVYESYLKSPYSSLKLSTYFNVYDQLLSKYRDKSIIFLEIGILDGGSLFMWRDFFGPQARIIGVDLNPEAKKWEKEGFEIFIGSQSDEKFWNDFINEVGEIDVVLDDGGHTYSQQIITTESLLPSIKDGGILVIEDTHTSYMRGYGDLNFSFIEYVKELIDKINMRFGGFHKEKSEHRFWSIEVVESIVAFKINKKATKLESKPTYNIGSSFVAKDFRFDDKNALMSVEQIFNKKKPNLNISLQQLENIILKVKIEHPDIANKIKNLLD